MTVDLSFYKNKRIFITGHTGFKGSWLLAILKKAGAEVTGYALSPQTSPVLFELIDLGNINSVTGDIRDYNFLKQSFDLCKPEIVIHMVAQPLVIESYKNPVYTYETNVMGTVNILEAVRKSESVKSFINVTTDKVYMDNEKNIAYKENDRLCGKDPYSNSKSCSELVTYSYKNSFFDDKNLPAISTARSGNVIGGGDFAFDRIIPDCVRAAQKKETIILRNPDSIRPYQHVLEGLSGYLLLAQKQYDKKYEGAYNFGPDDSDCITTGELTDLFCKKWGEGLGWEKTGESLYKEASFLKLNSSLSKNILGHINKWNIEKAVEKTVEWSKAYFEGKNINDIMSLQIEEYFGNV